MKIIRILHAKPEAGADDIVFSIERSQVGENIRILLAKLEVGADDIVFSIEMFKVGADYKDFACQTESRC